MQLTLHGPFPRPTHFFPEIANILSFEYYFVGEFSYQYCETWHDHPDIKEVSEWVQAHIPGKGYIEGFGSDIGVDCLVDIWVKDKETAMLFKLTWA